MLKTSTYSLDEWLSGWSTEAPTTYQRSSELAFQRWFRFKEAFSPALVRSVIEELPFTPSHIADCCAGSGTTAVVAQFLSIPSTVIEVNPFLIDLIKTKVTSYNDINFSEEYHQLERHISNTKVNISKLQKRLPPSFVEPGVRDRWLFFENVAVELERIRESINKLENSVVQRFFKIALASCLVPLSNARIDGKGRRYRKGWGKKKHTSEYVHEYFRGMVTDMVKDVCTYSSCKSCHCTTIAGDARNKIVDIERECDLFLFSPPYPNSFDYTDIYNIELWFLGYFKSAIDNTELRKQTLRSHVQVKWENPKGYLESNSLINTVNALNDKSSDLWDKRLPLMIQAYFEDIDMIISSIKDKLTKKGRICIIVGDSYYAGVCIDSAQIITDIAKKYNLILEKKRSERVMRSSIQSNAKEKFLNEWLLIFKKAN